MSKKEKKEIRKKNEEQQSFIKKSVTNVVDFSSLLWNVLSYKFILLIIAVFIVINCFTDFKANVKHKINKNTEKTVESMATESLQKIQLKISDEFSVLETLALFYDGNEHVELSTTNTTYERAIQSHPFVGIDLLSSTNEPLITLGTHVNYEEDIFIETVLAGENTVSSIVFDGNGNEYICLGVPVWKNDSVIGALVGSYNIKEFTKILDTSSFGQIGSIFISEEDGTLVARPESVGENTNLFDILDSVNEGNKKEIEKLKKNLVKGRSGLITYGNSKYKRYICYNVIPDTDWYSVSIVSGNAMDKTTRRVSRSAVRLGIKVSFVFVIYILITIGLDIKIAKRKRAGVTEE